MSTKPGQLQPDLCEGSSRGGIRTGFCDGAQRAVVLAGVGLTARHRAQFRSRFLRCFTRLVVDRAAEVLGGRRRTRARRDTAARAMGASSIFRRLQPAPPRQGRFFALAPEARGRADRLRTANTPRARARVDALDERPLHGTHGSFA